MSTATIKSFDVPETVNRLLAFMPPRGIEHRIVLNPTPGGVAVQVRLRAPETDIVVYGVERVPDMDMLGHLIEASHALLIESAQIVAANEIARKRVN